MKKLTLLLFVAGLFVISFTNTNCKRPAGDITPISGGDTQKTSTKIDSSGEDLAVTIYENTITTGSLQISGGTAVVYLFNNFTDYESYSNSGIHNSKYIDSAVITNGGSTCKLHVSAKQSTGYYFPSSAGAYAGQPYTYYMASVWHDPNGKIWKGWYTLGGDNTQAQSFDIAINNGNDTNGVPFPISVSQ